jgi:hypothetical protein
MSFFVEYMILLVKMWGVNMQKKITILLSLILVLTIGAISAGTLFYYKHENKQKTKKDTIQTQEDVEELSENADLYREEEFLSDEEAEEIEELEVKSKNTVQKEELKDQIIVVYEQKCASLRGEYDGKLQGLLEQCKMEYLKLPKEQRTAAKSALQLKYLKKGKALEKECGNRFESIMAQMQVELENNNLPSDYIDSARNQYAQEKSKREENFASSLKK